MTQTEKLRELIMDSGLKIGYIADKMGISRQTLAMKIENLTEFKPSEIAQLCEMLGIDSLEDKEDIFFAQEVDERQLAAEGSDGGGDNG